MFYLLDSSLQITTEVNYMNLWDLSGVILGYVPSQYEFLRVFVCVVLVFMLCMFIYSPILILKSVFENK